MTREQMLKFIEVEMQHLLVTLKAKNTDYTGASADDPFYNFTRVAAMGVASVEQGFLVRMSDKMSRLAGLVKNEGKHEVKDESMRDTLGDLAGYSFLLMAYLNHSKSPQKDSPGGFRPVSHTHLDRRRSIKPTGSNTLHTDLVDRIQSAKMPDLVEGGLREVIQPQ